MKILITKKQLEIIRENDSKKFNCDKCKHSWDIEKEDKNPYLCHMCGYDSHKKKYNYKELENFWKNYKNSEITEKWSEKYKKSINCKNPKGFSQRAHCQGKKKLTENKDKNNLDLHIKKINNISREYNIEPKNIIKNYLNYIIRNYSITPLFLYNIENIMHVQDCKTEHILKYIIYKLKIFFNPDTSNT